MNQHTDSGRADEESTSVDAKAQAKAKDRPPAAVQRHSGLLEDLAPPSVLINEQYRVLHMSETAGRYLRHRGGVVTDELPRLIRPELQRELRAALSEAFETQNSVLTPPIFVTFNESARRVVLAVRSQVRSDSEDVAQDADNSAGRLALVFFLEDETPEAATAGGEGQERVGSVADAQRDDRLAQAEAEVRRLHHRLQVTTEQYETSNEELKATNEQVETSKAELQSVNEELQTVNAKLKDRLEEISRAHSDLENLMAVTEIATLFLGRDLCIRRYTPGTAALFHIRPGDRGRPIDHLANKLAYAGLSDDAAQVLKTLSPLEREVQDAEGHWFLVRLRPYRTVENRIDGVVLTFVDINMHKEAERALRRNEERLRLAQEAAGVGTFEWNIQENVNRWSPELEHLYGLPEGSFRGTYEAWAALVHPDDLSEAERRVQIALETGQFDAEWRVVRPNGEIIWILARGWVEMDAEGKPLRMIGANVDITSRVRAEKALQESEQRYRALAATLEERVERRTREVQKLAAELTLGEQKERNRVAQILHDDLQQQLFAVQIRLSFLDSAYDEQDDEAFADQAAELKSMLAAALETMRGLSVDLSPAILQNEGLTEAFGWLAAQMKERHQLQVTIEAQESFPVPDERLRVLLFQSVRELLFNVVKHAEARQAGVRLQRENECVRITVHDDGRGFDREKVMAGARRGSGLATLRYRLSLVGGKMTVETRPGDGARITIQAPLRLEEKGGCGGGVGTSTTGQR